MITVVCGKPCEGNRDTDTRLALDNCYHENWYHSFQREGWSRCRSGYYLSGLYRGECDSLYCINLGLCCSIEKAVWQSCDSANWFQSFKKEGASMADPDTFITGLYRGRGHNLSDIQMVSNCSFLRTPRDDNTMY